MDKKKISVVLVGCGDRGTVYCNQGIDLGTMELVAAVDPNPERLRYMQEIYGISAQNCYLDKSEVLKQGRIADCAIVATLDQYHKESVIPFLEQGYDVLLEKPVVNNEKDLLEIEKVAKENNSRLIVCHVLRYTPFFKKVKEFIDSGSLGEIMNMESSERVCAFHGSAAYIRGKWNSEKECGSSLLLAKCCHDIDVLCWLNNKARVEEVYSMGGRDFFTPEHAPKGSGTRCMVDCPEEIRKKCVYDAEAMYIDNCLIPQYPWQCTGKNWQDVTEEEKIESLKTYNPHGVCIFKGDGDIVDHQHISLRFSDNVTASHTVILGSMKGKRTLWIQGTEGELEGSIDEGILIHRYFDKSRSWYLEETFNFSETEGTVGGHYGGDRGLIKDFSELLSGQEPSTSCTSIDDSIQGHLVCYAADQSMKEDRIIKL